MSTSGVLGFLTMVGTRYEARADGEKLQLRLRAFRTALEDNVAALGGTDHVYVFNDNAYVSTSTVAAMATFLEAVRGDLLAEGFYVKGAVGPGALTKAKTKSRRMSSNMESQRRSKLVGDEFSNEAIQLYSIQERIRGVGIGVHPTLAERLKARVVDNCYIGAPSRSAPAMFQDLKLRIEDLSRTNLDSVLLDVFTDHGEGGTLGVYLLPLLINWVQSFPLDESESDGEDDLGDIFHLLITSAFERHFRDVRGVELVYYAALNRMYNEEESAKRRTQFVKFILSRKRLVKLHRNVPMHLLSADNRSAFLKAYSRSVHPARKDNSPEPS